ncbi:hypothetical protein GUJ93_ZPchr0005g16059 [Zizania palustris]|uniref:non-specific serine/threonine protein kinase n=1 Tax=Zizania palustris TaxID=103762 RepID=A0A8J5SLD0_ZIZPA|nr:hypothetical protein GUJ93_ZPchr0005g16059 [Zizania palustris]
MLPTSSSWLRPTARLVVDEGMRPGDMAAAAAAAAAKLPRFTTYAALFPTPGPFGSRPAKPALPPIYISMDPALVDPAHLQALMLACAHSCAIRASASPSPPAGAAAEPVDLRKLRVALAHSFLVVSVFCSARFLDEGDGRRFLGLDIGLGLGRQEDRRLVGFGRAVSDVGLTASVHDVVVHPSLQRRGIGQKIVERITRVLHNRGIFDISALCTETERPFFEACGFGDDAMAACSYATGIFSSNGGDDANSVASSSDACTVTTVPISASDACATNAFFVSSSYAAAVTISPSDTTAAHSQSLPAFSRDTTTPNAAPAFSGDAATPTPFPPSPSTPSQPPPAAPAPATPAAPPLPPGSPPTTPSPSPPKPSRSPPSTASFPPTPTPPDSTPSPPGGFPPSPPSTSPPSLLPPSLSSPSSSSPASSSSPSTQSRAVIGITAAVAAVVVIGLVAGLFYCSRKSRRRPPPPPADLHGQRLPVTSQQQSHPLASPFTSTPPPMYAPQQQQQAYSPWQSSGGAGAGGSDVPTPLPPPVTGGTLSYADLDAATGGFSEGNLLGQGGFGHVYRGTLRGGREEVAIKKLRPGSGQGDREFHAEVEIISRVHHRNLVSLVGYCIYGDHRLLVYEYVPNKTLEFHLHGSGRPTLDWPRRWKIAVGAAKGLAYLHEDCRPKIIHRDIKAANILLDYNFEPKVRD